MVNWTEEARRLREEGATYAQIARRLGLSRQRIAAVLGPLGVRRGRLPAAQSASEPVRPLGRWAALELGCM